MFFNNIVNKVISDLYILRENGQVTTRGAGSRHWATQAIVSTGIVTRILQYSLSHIFSMERQSENPI